VKYRGVRLIPVSPIQTAALMLSPRSFTGMRLRQQARVISTDEWGEAGTHYEWGKAGTHYRCPRPGRRLGLRLCCIRFCIFRYYHYLSIVQINLFIPSRSYTATKSQSFPFGVKIFRRSALAWGPDKLFSPWPEPPVGGPMCCGRNNTLWQYMCL
jgi:hypothetical protein